MLTMADFPGAVFLLRIFSPAVVFISALSLLSVKPRPADSTTSPITSVVVATTVPRRAAILFLLSFVALSYFADGIVFVVYAVLTKQWPRHSGIPLNTVLGLISFSGIAVLGAWKDVHGASVWGVKRLKTAISASLLLDIALAILLGLNVTSKQSQPHIPEKPETVTLQTWLHLAFPAFRVLLLLPLLVSLSSPHTVYTPVATTDEINASEQPTASSFLLPPEAPHQPASALSGLSPEQPSTKYGTFRTPRSTLQSAPATRAATPAPSTGADRYEQKPEISLEPTWSELFARIGRLTPHLWPSKSRYLQFLAALCIVILLIGRVVNLALPFTLGKLISTLEEGSGSPWAYLFAYVGLRFLQGTGGLSAIRDALWAPVMQYSDLEMSQLAFDHILNLSFAWHTRRKTGEVLRILDRGAAINHTFELILFNIVPTFIDIFIALAAFSFYFEWTLALVIFVIMFAYVAASIILTQQRTRLRRQMNDRDVITRGIHTDCLLNYETVKYFGGEEHEGERYREAMREYQKLELKVMLALNLLNLVQNFIITLGLLIGSLLVANRITHGEWAAKHFVIFITYLAQLYGPLNQLGYIYRSVNQSLVDTERLLALLNEPTEVNDKPDATALEVTSGEIEFQNVSFSYDGRTTALNQVSFKVPKGSSVALVGESGSGKSTILRLLYRFYDLGVGEGRILIDGQDIRDVTQKSLRQAIGVVPQDSVLFNSSIAYNIGYGKFGATLEEIEDAAKSAQMHDRILSFPDGYNTKVGERGVRLSGGEKQRVAIARTLLKNPPILLLDEATSALDTSTEKDIQKALQNLVRGRSSLSIAHRLSTIASADLILVLKDGQIIEQGNHKELLALDGVFASMWADQVSASEEPAPSIGGTSLKKERSQTSFGKEEVQGYNAESELIDLDDTVQADNKVADLSVEPEQPKENGDHPAVPSDLPSDVVKDSEETVQTEDKAESKAEEPVVDAAEPEEREAEVKPVADNVFAPVAFPPVAFPSSGEVVEEPEPIQIRDSPKNEPITLESTPSGEDNTTTAVPIAAPAPAAAATAPVAFPKSDSASTIHQASDKQPEATPSAATPASPPQPVGVTFGASAFSPPSRTGTPDPDAEPKRKRISSQNFQRLARRLSLTTRRQSSGSSIIPVLKRDRDQSPRVSVDDSARAEGSTSGATSESPAGSTKEDDQDKKKKKKEKKDKKDKKKGTL